jgi:hypothetical protein
VNNVKFRRLQRSSANGWRGWASRTSTPHRRPDSVKPTSSIHQIVIGATKEELDKVFTKTRPGKYDLNFLRVSRVTNVGQTICDVLRREPQVWQHPWDNNEPSSSRPAKTYRAEYYVWTLKLSRGERMFRYGCDRHFNPLIKKPRQVHVKLPKTRPYPKWLEPHMFGRGKWENIEPNSMTYEAKNKARRLSVPGDDYYKMDKTGSKN